MYKIEIKKGEKFNRFEIIEELPTVNKIRKFKCKCDCGNIKIVRLNSLRTGNTKSCGCLKKEILNKTTHGMSKSKEYNSWLGMKNRCLNSKDKFFNIYGGRGIKICDNWINSFDNFISDMGIKPKSNFSLDRINVDGNYEPSNCRWASPKEQANNRR
jgi:hypothetical protein